MTGTYHIDIDGPVALRIDKDTYSDLINVSNKGQLINFPVPVETDVVSNKHKLEDAKIIVQLLRITDEYLDALSRTGFDITRILSPERLAAYRLNMK